MANIKRANASSITKSGVAISDVPDAPTIGAVTDLVTGGGVTVAFTPAVTGGTATTFTATSSPGGVTGTGSSPITVTGLTVGTAYTFTVTASNSTGTSAPSAASASVTPTTYIVGSYEQIASTTVDGSGPLTITFSDIPQTYSHLQIRAHIRPSAGNDLRMQINGDTTGTNYYSHYLNGAGGGSATTGSGSTYYTGNGLGYNAADLANVYGAHIIDILDYSNTTKNKTTRTFHGVDYNGSGQVALFSGLWRNTSAVNSIVFSNLSGGTFTTNSQIALYGVK